MDESAAPRRIFAYGTLVAAEVLEALVGQRLPARSATLPDYASYRVRGQSFPGLVPEPGALTLGVVYEGMDAAQLLVLDRFEGSFYAREPVEVRCGSDDGLAVEAYVVVPGQRAALTSETWDLEHWRAHHLTRELRDWGLDRFPAQASAWRNTEST